MKVIEKAAATGTLADYAAEIGKGPIVVTNRGKPVAVLVAIDHADLETVALSTNKEFLALIERSRQRARAEGAISSQEMRRRFSRRAKKQGRLS
jgi:antitoxin (DNA-binding transcriptional repressor) of toxin-antitoxin stability system